MVIDCGVHDRFFVLKVYPGWRDIRMAANGIIDNWAAGPVYLKLPNDHILSSQIDVIWSFEIGIPCRTVTLSSMDSQQPRR